MHWRFEKRYCMKYLGDGIMYEEKIIEGDKIKIYTKGETRYTIKSPSNGDATKFTLWDGNIVKSIKVISNG